MKKKVLHLLYSNSYSGAENVACTIIENMSDMYDMYYVCPKGPIEEVLKERGIKYFSLKKFNILEIRKVIKNNHFDIIHAHDYKASFLAALCGFKGKIISQLHLNWDFSSSWNLYTIAYRLVMKRFSKIVAVSKEIIDEAVFTKKNNDKFIVLTNVVDKKEVLRKANLFKSDSYDLIFVGRFNKIKRPEIVVEIIKILKDKYPNIRTCMIGNGELFDNCNKLIKDYGLENNIELLGFKENPFPYLKSAKVALMPSSYEGLGLVAIESMILGTIVLNSGAGGLKSIFSNYSKYICNDIYEYVNKIEEILKEEKVLYKSDCDKMVKNFTDIRKYKKKLSSIYEEL